MKIFKMNIAVNYARTISLLLALLLFVISSSAQALIQRSFVNLGFEAVQISNTSPCRVYASQGSSVPGWSTTHPVYTGGGRVVCSGTVNPGVDTTSSAPIFEVWKGPRDMGGGSGNCSTTAENCISGRTGSQFVELNADSLSEIRQQVCLETGETVGWKFSHNGRNTTADKMRFKAATQSIVQVATSTIGSGSVSACDTGTCNTPQSARTTTTGDTRWADYSGSFTASGSNNTYIGFESLNGTSTSGNFVDDIQVTLKPAVEFKLGNYTDVENISASQSVEVQVVGIVPANISLNFTIDPTSTAVIGTDYTMNNGTSTSFNIPLAAGDYSDGKVISIPVKLLNNSVVEGSRSFKVILTADATKFTIMPTSSCTNTGGNATSTYSIQDDDIGLQLEKTWVNASVNDKATLTSTGGASGAANINYVSTASAANVSNASNSIILTAGESRTLAETLSSSNTGAYNASVWSCDGGSLSGSVLTTSTADYGKVIKCTVTNSRMTSLQLAKVWGTNSLTTDGATIGATTGGSNNTAPFTTAGGTNANSGAPVIITAGNTITFPAETGTNIANYNTVLGCTANGGATANALSGTNGQATNTLVIGTGDAGKSIACTYTNTRKSTTFRLAKAWGANSTAGNVANLGATTGLTNNTTAFTSTASTATNGTAVTVYAGETVTLPAETMSSGTLINYNTVISCNAGTLTGANGQSTGNTLAITATTTNPITCTYTNTRKSATLTLQKIWANAKLNDAASISATGLTSLSAVANTPSETDATAGQTVYAGDSITLGETFTTGSASNYNSTLACTGNTTALAGSTLTVNPADTAITCSYTNSRIAQQFNLSKQWQNAVNGHSATVTITGGSNNASVSSTSTGNNSTSGSAVTVYAGDVITLPAETLAGGASAAQYNSSFACSGGSTLISGAVGRSITISNSTTATVCTYTNARATASVTLRKVWSGAASNDTATLSLKRGATSVDSLASTASAAAQTDTDSTPFNASIGETLNLSETLGGSNVGQYTATLSCDNGVTVAANGDFSVPATASICTITNTRKTRTVMLSKGLIPTTDSGKFNLLVNGTAVATNIGNGGTGNVSVPVDSTVSISETAGTATTLGNYTSSLSCTGVSGVSGTTSGSFIQPDTDVNCTFNNIRKGATLTIVKQWQNGKSGDAISIPATTGLSNNTAVLTSTANASGNNSSIGTAVNTFIGETAVFGSESFTTGSVANYTTILACSGAADTDLSDGLTIGAADTAITCTYTNAIKATDLEVNKTALSSLTQGSQITYTVKVWNKGPIAASSSTVTDTVPASITGVTWSCSASGSAACGTVSGTGNSISVTTGALPVNNVTTAPTSGSYLTFTVTGTAASVGNISNTASIAVTSGTDPVTTNNTSQATTTVNSSIVITPDPKQKEARFVITPDLPTIYRGQAGAQLVTIKNEGPDDASGTVATFKPRAQTGVTVTSVKVAGGSACSLSAGSWSCPVGSVANNGSFQLEVSYDTTSSATLGTAIQADIRVNSNEFNPGSGVGESVYHIWGAENQQTIPSTNGAFMVGYNGTGGNVTGSGNGNFGPFSYEGTSIESAWPANQNSPTGGYLDYGISGANSSYYLASTNSAPPMIDRLINSLAGLSVKLPLINPATNSLVDNRRAWEIRTGALIPTNVPSQQYTLCVGDSSQKLDDSAYIMINGVRQGIARDTYSNTIYTVPVTLNSGYNSISYRIANRNSTNGNGGEVNEGGFSTIGIFTGGNCLTGALDDLINIGQTASIKIIEKPQVTITGQVFEDNSGTTTVNSNAYNGIKDAGELGIADSIVTINNCTNNTAIATTQTNANGEYTFSLLPSDLPAGNFCIAQKNLDGYSSVSGTAGYNRVTDQITLSNTGASSYANQNFGDARLNAVLTEDGQQTIIAGGVADYPHHLTAQSVLTVTSINQTNTQQPANSTDAPWQSLLYRDLNCNGKVDGGENLISASLPLSLKANEQVCLVQRVYAPATASMGAQHIGQLQASFNIALANPTETITGTSIKRQDTTLLGSAGLSMQKMVRSVANCPSTTADTAAFATNNQAQSGGYLEYEITYRNNSLKNLVDISIKDTVPVGTVFQSNGCNVTPAGTCTASKTGDALLWQNTGILLPSQQGKVRFCVQIP